MLEPGVLDSVLELRQRLDRDVVPAGRQAGAEDTAERRRVFRWSGC